MQFFDFRQDGCSGYIADDDVGVVEGDRVGNFSSPVAGLDIGMRFIRNESVGVCTPDPGEEIKIAGNSRIAEADREVVPDLSRYQDASPGRRPFDRGALSPEIVFGNTAGDETGNQPPGAVQQRAIEFSLDEKKFEVAPNARVEMHATAVENNRCGRHEIRSEADRADEAIFDPYQRNSSILSFFLKPGWSARGPDGNRAARPDAGA